MRVWLLMMMALCALHTADAQNTYLLRSVLTSVTGKCYHGLFSEDCDMRCRIAVSSTTSNYAVSGYSNEVSDQNTATWTFGTVMASKSYTGVYGGSVFYYVNCKDEDLLTGADNMGTVYSSKATTANDPNWLLATINRGSVDGIRQVTAYLGADCYANAYGSQCRYCVVPSNNAYTCDTSNGYRVCATNWYPTNDPFSGCTFQCIAQDSDAQGHYTCNSATGAKVCRSGYITPSTNCKTRLSCGSTPVISHASRSLTTGVYEDVATYTCSDNYSTTGKGTQVGGTTQFTITCLGTGSWSTPGSCVPVACGVAPVISKATLGTVLEADIITALDAAQPSYKCTPGYTTDAGALTSANDNFVAQCSSTGLFTNVLSCNAISCGVPPTMTNADASQPSSIRYYLPPFPAVYTCRTGYSLDGSPVGSSAQKTFTRTCTTAATFDGTSFAPGCSLVTCPTPPSVSDATITSTASQYNADPTSNAHAASYTCNTGYSTNGLSAAAGGIFTFTRACLESATYDNVETVCVRIKCPPPAQDTWTSGPTASVNFGDTVQLSCKTGATVGGIPAASSFYERTCLDTGLYSATTPANAECLPVSCGIPQPIAHATLSSTNTVSFGGAVTYACDTGYSTDRAPATTVNSKFIRSCLASGSFDNLGMSCLAIECTASVVQHATASAITATVGGSITYSCDEGFSTDGSPVSSSTNGAFSAACLATGQLDLASNVCQKVSCGTPPSIDFSTSSSGELLFGVQRRIDCDTGYTVTGETSGQSSFNIGCSPSGTFTGIVSCLPISCGILPILSGSTPASTASLRFSQTVLYTCDGGATVDGQPGSATTFSVTCDQTGAYAGTRVCGTISCGIAPTITNSARSCTQGNIVGDACTYSCNTGFKQDPPSASNTRTCTSSGAWDNVDLACVTTLCATSPSAVAFSTRACTSPLTGPLAHGESCTYTCQVGYEAVSGGATSPATRTCLSESWSWTNNLALTCTAISCGTLPTTPNAVTQAPTTLFFGDTATIECRTGYTTTGLANGVASFVRTCESSGQLSNDATACLPVSCGVPPNIQSASPVSTGAVSFGSGATYNCASGTSILGVSGGATQFTLDCYANGTFSVAPVCKAITCAVPTVDAASASVLAGPYLVGDTAVVSCNAGHTVTGIAGDPSSYSLMCLADGSFSTSTSQCTKISCGFPPSSTHATSPGASAFFGEQTVFTCDSGYSLTGTASGATTFSITCLASGTFSATSSCQIISCNVPPLAAHATAAASTTPRNAGESVVYTCDAGYTLGSSVTTFTALCTNTGVYSNVVGCNVRVCDAVPTVGNAAAPVCTPASLEQGDTCTYACESGFEATTADTRRVCQSTGAWNNTGLACIRTACPDPFFVANADVACTAATSSDNCVYTCAVGYTALVGVSPATATCSTGSWSWSNSALTCTPQACVSTPNDPAASESSLTTKVFGETVTYTCFAGFVVGGSTDVEYTRECRSDQSWSNAGASCQPIVCGSAPAVPNANFTTVSSGASSSSLVYPQTATYTCNVGYTLSGTVGDVAPLIVNCQTDGTFDVGASVCMPVQCPVPADTTSVTALTTASTASFGTAVGFTCRSGYTLIGGNVDGTFSRVCQANGMLTTTSATCPPVSCGVPPTAADASWSATAVTYNQNVAYTCAPGFTVTGTVDGASTFSITCQSDGTYTPLQVCTRIFCGTLPSIKSASSISLGAPQFYNDSTVYYCAAGHTTDGLPTPSLVSSERTSFTVTCGPNGQFLNVQACITVSCPGSVPAVSDSTSICTGAQVGSGCTYTCNDGYAPSSNHTQRICQIDGTYTNSDFACDLTSCGAPPADVSHVERTCTSDQLTHGESCDYTCVTGYRGTARARECANSQWQWVGGSPISCQPVNCGPTPSMASAVATTSGDPANVLFTESVTYTCNPGFSVTGTSLGASTFQRTCLASGEFDHPDNSTCEAIACGVPPTVANAQAQDTRVQTAGQTVTYTCLSGYSNDSSVTGDRSFDVHCDLSGTFSTPGMCMPQACGAIPTEQYATASLSGTFSFGQSVVYTCESGYTTTGVAGELAEFTRSCNAGGTVSASTVGCVPVSCGLPPSESHATALSPSIPVSYPAIAEYNCESYHTTSGLFGGAILFNRTCDADGTFGPASASCNPISCGAATVVSNAAISTGTTPLLFNDRTTYTCAAGYTATHTTFNATCQTNGQLTGVQTCTAVRCGIPPVAGLASIVSAPGAPNVIYPTMVQYECDMGYEIKSTGLTTFSVACESSGSFASFVPLCEAIVCGVPPVQSNARLVSPKAVDTISYTGEIVYECLTGYTTTGVLGGPTFIERNCTHTGAFSTGDSCLPISCGITPLVTSASSSQQIGVALAFGEMVTWTCTAGYVFAATNVATLTSTCDATGLLVPAPVASCARQSCGTVPTLVHGSYACSTGVFQDVCAATCDDGYVLQSPGDTGVTCASSGLWTGSVLCVDVDECQTANGGCAQVCTNTDGHVLCSCSPGYQGSGLASDGASACALPDLCANAGCEGTCTNVPFGFVCSCPDPTTELGTDRTSCVPLPSVAPTVAPSPSPTPGTPPVVTVFVNSQTPLVTSIGTSVVIVLNGTFDATGVWACEFVASDGASAIVSSSAVRVSSTRLECTVDAIGVAQARPLSLTLNGVSVTIVTAPSLSLGLVWLAPAPTLTSAMFSPDYLRVDVVFDVSVRVQGGPFLTVALCAAVFVDAATQLGATAECRWSSLSTMQITLSTTSTLMPDDTLVLRRNPSVLFLASTPYSFAASGSVTVDGYTPAGATSVPPLVPVVRIVGLPDTVSACDTATTVAYAVDSGSGGRSVTLAWQVTSVMPDDGGALQTLLDGQSALTPLTAVPIASALQVDTSYAISLVVTNFLGTSSLPVVTHMNVTSRVVPSVTFPQANTAVSRSVVNSFSVSVVLPSSCTGIADASSILYQWSIEPSIPLGASATAPILVIGANELARAATYTLSVVATLATDSTVYGSAQQQLEVLQTPLLASIIGPTTIGAQFALTLTAQCVDNDGTGGAPCTFAWTCIDCDNTFTTAGSFSSVVPVRNEAVLALPADSLFSLRSYRFQVEVSRDTRTATATHIVSASTFALPIVSVVPRLGADGKVDVSERVFVDTEIESSFPATLLTQWSNSGSGAAALDMSDLSIYCTGFTREMATLCLRADVLSPGVTYLIAITVTDQLGSVTASTSLPTRNSPSTGSVTVPTSDVFALLSQSTLTASGWIDSPDNAPLSFSFGFVGARDAWIPLPGESQDSTITSLLPSPTDQSSTTVTVRARITNRFGSRAVSDSSVTVRTDNMVASSGVSTAAAEASVAAYASEVAANTTTQLASSGNVQVALSEFVAALATLNAYWDTTVGDACAHTSVVALAQQLLNKVVVSGSTATLDSVTISEGEMSSRRLTAFVGAALEYTSQCIADATFDASYEAIELARARFTDADTWQVSGASPFDTDLAGQLMRPLSLHLARAASSTTTTTTTTSTVIASMRDVGASVAATLPPGVMPLVVDAGMTRLLVGVRTATPTVSTATGRRRAVVYATAPFNNVVDYAGLCALSHSGTCNTRALFDADELIETVSSATSCSTTSGCSLAAIWLVFTSNPEAVASTRTIVSDYYDVSLRDTASPQLSVPVDMDEYGIQLTLPITSNTTASTVPAGQTISCVRWSPSSGSWTPSGSKRLAGSSESVTCLTRQTGTYALAVMTDSDALDQPGGGGGTGGQSSGSSSSLPIIAAIVAVAVVILLIVLVVLWRRRRNSQAKREITPVRSDSMVSTSSLGFGKYYDDKAAATMTASEDSQINALFVDAQQAEDMYDHNTLRSTTTAPNRQSTSSLRGGRGSSSVANPVFRADSGSSQTRLIVSSGKSRQPKANPFLSASGSTAAASSVYDTTPASDASFAPFGDSGASQSAYARFGGQGDNASESSYDHVASGLGYSTASQTRGQAASQYEGAERMSRDGPSNAYSGLAGGVQVGGDVYADVATTKSFTSQSYQPTTLRPSMPTAYSSVSGGAEAPVYTGIGTGQARSFDSQSYQTTVTPNAATGDYQDPSHLRDQIDLESNVYQTSAPSSVADDYAPLSEARQPAPTPSSANDDYAPLSDVRQPVPTPAVDSAVSDMYSQAHVRPNTSTNGAQPLRVTTVAAVDFGSRGETIS